MKVGIFLASFLAFAVTVSSIEMLKLIHERKKTYRIIGGHPAVQSKWPYIVVVAMGPIPLCGGSLIRSDWVLTAAHCIDTESFYTFTNYPLGLGIGIIDLTDAFGPDRSVKAPTIKDFILADHQIFHPEYKKYEIGQYQFFTYDVALIRLSKSVDLSKGHGIAKLVGQTAQVGRECSSAGWGIEDYTQKETRSAKSSILYALELKISDTQYCFKSITEDVVRETKKDPDSFSADLNKVLFDKLCIVPLNSIDDVSKSDHGGPLRCGEGDYGVLSGKEIPSIDLISRKGTYILFTDISRYSQWITTTSAQKPASQKPADLTDSTQTDKDDMVRARAYKFEQRSLIFLFMLVYILQL